MAHALDGYPRAAPPLRPPAHLRPAVVRPRVPALAGAAGGGRRRCSRQAPALTSSTTGSPTWASSRSRCATRVLGATRCRTSARFLRDQRPAVFDRCGRRGTGCCSLRWKPRVRLSFRSRAPLFGIPYTWARMRMQRDGRCRSRYESTRRWPHRGLRSRDQLADRCRRPSRRPLEEWLTARWGAHSRVLGRTIWVPNAHEAWPLYEAEVLELSR